MLKLSEFLRYSIHASDGHLGQVVDVFFDDETWTVRYVVVELGGWLHRRRTLISPVAVTSVLDGERQLSVDLTSQQVANAPSVDTDRPFSRQMELKYRDYFSWPFYWIAGFSEPLDPAFYARSYAAEEDIRAGRSHRKERLIERPKSDGNPHLRSATAIVGYHVMTRDGEVGRVTDFMLDVDENGWRVLDLLLEVGHWPHHAEVSIAPYWIEEMSWPTATVKLSVGRKTLESRLTTSQRAGGGQ